MNGCFAAMLLCGAVFALGTGRLAQAQAALLSGGGEAVALCISLAGTYAFFGGMMGVLRESGAADALARALRRPLRKLLRVGREQEDALPDICLNIASNMLGMGGAATPAGLAAMKKLVIEGERAANAPMIRFLVLNATGVQLLPTTIIALRQQAGAGNPADVVWPTLAATTAATLAGLATCRVCERRGDRRGKE